MSAQADPAQPTPRSVETLATLQRHLRPYQRTLWGQVPALHAMPPLLATQRAHLSEAGLHLPAAWRAQRGGLARQAYQAAVAHAHAHLRFAGVRHERGTLKPIQIALLGLLEDARVEWHAARELPGLRTLWGSFHTAGAHSGPTFEALLLRLAHCLLNPGHADAHPWVQKGRALFYADAEGSRLACDDAAALRRAASLLGNDIGQMRLQFNARDYVVEPAYRDDNAHLWTTPPEHAQALEMQEQRRRAGPDDGGDEPPDALPEVQLDAPPDAPPGTDAPPQPAGSAARPAHDPQALADPTCVTDEAVFVYPEWDRLIGRLRPQWVTVRESQAPAGDAAAMQALLGTHGELVSLTARRLQAAHRPRGLPPRPQRAAEGDGFDLDAMVGARLAQRLRQPPDPRVYRRPPPRAPVPRDGLSVLLLLDTSASTAQPVCAGGPSALHLLRGTALLAAAALQQAGHRCAILSFSSNGRHHVRARWVQRFGEMPADRAVLARAAGLRGEWSTRLGAVARHARTALAGQPGRHVALALTDGAPHDVDVHDSRYLPADWEAAQRSGRDLHLGVIRVRPSDVAAVAALPAGAGSAVEAQLMARLLAQTAQALTQILG